MALHLRRRQIRELVKPGKVNVKYSPGGIIDIEYAVQYLQILHGKDHPELRTPSTLEALDSLRRLKIISQKEQDHLRRAYIFLRTLIDGLRMVRGNARDLILPEPATDVGVWVVDESSARVESFDRPEWHKFVYGGAKRPRIS